MTTLEHLVSIVETHVPKVIEIFAPKFSVSFLWRVIDELALYRRKSLDRLTIHVSTFANNGQISFTLSECIEIQELIDKIEIKYIDLASIGLNEKTLSGLIYLYDHDEKLLSFETEFTLDGFAKDSTIAFSTKRKNQNNFQTIRVESTVINRNNFELLKTKLDLTPITSLSSSFIFDNAINFELPFVSVRSKHIHNAGAGLNWGQPTSTRVRKDINASYLPVPITAQEMEALPQANRNFLCKFEDGVEFEMVRTGRSGKNLTSAYDNQIFGRYIRYVLGLSSGTLITQQDLVKASIFGLRFYKNKDGSYFVTFSNMSDF